MTYCVYNDYLEHHGILGQKWGKRNGPPYPLDEKDHSKAEIKLAKEGKSNYSKNNSSQKTSYKVNKDSEKTHYKVNKESEKTKEPKDHSKLKTAAKVGLAVGATAFVGYTAYKVYNHYQIQSIIKKTDLDLDAVLKKEWGESATLDQLSRISGPISTAENMAKVNLGIDVWDEKNFGNPRLNNCQLCSAAMAMREKGYDVIAGDYNGVLASSHLMPKWFDGVKETVLGSGKMSSKPEDITKEIFNSIQSNGEGSYGALHVVWNVGGGHSMFYKVENGLAKIYDGQSGVSYDFKDFTEDIAPSIDLNRSNHFIYDMTNAVPTDKVLQVLMKPGGH